MSAGAPLKSDVAGNPAIGKAIAKESRGARAAGEVHLDGHFSGLLRGLTQEGADPKRAAPELPVVASDRSGDARAERQRSRESSSDEPADDSETEDVELVVNVADAVAPRATMPYWHAGWISSRIRDEVGSEATPAPVEEARARARLPEAQVRIAAATENIPYSGSIGDVIAAAETPPDGLPPRHVPVWQPPQPARRVRRAQRLPRLVSRKFGAPSTRKETLRRSSLRGKDTCCWKDPASGGRARSPQSMRPPAIWRPPLARRRCPCGNRRRRPRTNIGSRPCRFQRRPWPPHPSRARWPAYRERRMRRRLRRNRSRRRSPRPLETKTCLSPCRQHQMSVRPIPPVSRPRSSA